MEETILIKQDSLALLQALTPSVFVMPTVVCILATFIFPLGLVRIVAFLLYFF